MVGIHNKEGPAAWSRSSDEGRGQNLRNMGMKKKKGENFLLFLEDLKYTKNKSNIIPVRMK